MTIEISNLIFDSDLNLYFDSNTLEKMLFLHRKGVRSLNLKAFVSRNKNQMGAINHQSYEKPSRNLCLNSDLV